MREADERSGKKLAFICDLDGTLCNTDHRQHLVEAKKWDEFYEALDGDPVNLWCEDLVFALHHGDAVRYQPIFVSGRQEKYRRKTVEWFARIWELETEQVTDDSFILFMRKDGDFRQDAVIKEEIYRQHIEPKFHVAFAIDDRQQVVNMWRRIGIVCLQCAEGNF